LCDELDAADGGGLYLLREDFDVQIYYEGVLNH
jgi:hypothetical protein